MSRVPELSVPAALGLAAQLETEGAAPRDLRRRYAAFLVREGLTGADLELALNVDDDEDQDRRFLRALLLVAATLAVTFLLGVLGARAAAPRLEAPAPISDARL
ncbi:MAG: hypothetical protein R3F20_08050 [Planctomycetota bacterium]